jgi:Recombinase
MPRKERIREAVTSLANPNYLTDRAAAGWRMAAIEWERDIPDEIPESQGWSEDIPYGMQVSGDGAHLIENPAETEIVVLALDMIVEDCPLSQVSSEMNRRGYRMRDAKPWTPTALFTLLPRMIQMGPRVFSSEQWMHRRQKLPRVV